MKKTIFAGLFVFALAMGAYFTAQAVSSKNVTANACDTPYCNP